jgi:glycosyltransferase involved in cell wall biosynthesis
MLKPTITIIGPYASEYSLSKVNRNLAMSLDAVQSEYSIKLWGTPDAIDRMPSTADLKRYPLLEGLISKERPIDDITIFNNFPKSAYAKYGLEDMPGIIKIGYIAWEESIFPKKLVEECNDHLHGMIAASEHTKEIFLRSGIRIPIKVIHEGLDIPFTKPVLLKIKSKAKFKFFHVSSGQYRKGVDVLLNAYFAEFKDDPNVVLVLKLFPNVSSSKDINAIIIKNQNAKCQVEIINDAEISDGQLRSLYEQCDAVVFPTRGEGFGLVMAESLAIGKPMITTGYSGHMDFCSEENCYLLDYVIKPSDSHLGITGAKLAEPDVNDLRAKMRFLYENIDSDEVKKKVAVGIETVKDYRWNVAAKKVKAFVDDIKMIAGLEFKKIAVLTTYNSKCGISEYSKDMYGRMVAVYQNIKIVANYDIGDRVREDKDFVERTWQYGENDFDKTLAFFKKFEPEIIHIQFNPAFYQIGNLKHIVDYAESNKAKIYITLHSYLPQFKEHYDLLSKFDKIFVHSQRDYNSVLTIGEGLTNLTLLEHGINVFPDEDKFALRKKVSLTENSPILASHGLIHDKKGLVELLEALAILKKDNPKILLVMANAINPNNSTSAMVFQKMQAVVEAKGLKNNVIFINKFLEFAQIVKTLQLADVVVLPYGDVVEGASGAVRTCISAGRPIIVTDSYIFDSLPVGVKMPDNKPATIAKFIKTLLEDPEAYLKEKYSVREYALSCSWDEIIIKYLKYLVE